MGLFNKKSVNKFKEYSLNETISLLKLPKYQGFTAVEVSEEGRYKIVPEKEARQHIEKIKEVKRADRAFANRISNNGQYRELESIKTPKYGDYQGSKGYNSADWSR